jgi:hypothetical protein
MSSFRLSRCGNNYENLVNMNNKQIVEYLSQIFFLISCFRIDTMYVGWVQIIANNIVLVYN